MIPVLPLQEAKCNGESNHGSHVCSGRDVCWRYVSPARSHEHTRDFWKAENCANSLSVPKG